MCSTVRVFAPNLHPQRKQVDRPNRRFFTSTGFAAVVRAFIDYHCNAPPVVPWLLADVDVGESDDPIPDLRKFGYTEREAAFLYLVGIHSGYFLRRQYLTFTEREDGAMCSDSRNTFARHGRGHILRPFGSSLHRAFARREFLIRAARVRKDERIVEQTRRS